MNIDSKQYAKYQILSPSCSQDIVLKRFFYIYNCKGHNSNEKQSSVTTAKYDPLQVMGTVTDSP